MKKLYEEKKMEQRKLAVKCGPSPAMMIAEEDVEELIYQWRHVLKWIKAHVITKYPAHRYEGDLMIDDECLIFHGHDIKENEDYEDR